jgi:polysaccharide biosynthesis protein PslG
MEWVLHRVILAAMLSVMCLGPSDGAHALTGTALHASRPAPLASRSLSTPQPPAAEPSPPPAAPTSAPAPTVAVPRAVTAAAPPPARAPARAPRPSLPALRGVQLHALWDSEYSALATELDLSANAGANTVRVDVGWSSLETQGPGVLSDWYVGRLDSLMRGAAQRHLGVIATLWSTPCWASSAPERLRQGCAGSWWDRGVVRYPPTDPATYGRIAAWLTRRYGTELAALEVWNEPNLTDGRFLVAADPAAAYATLLRAGYAGAKSGDARVPVLAGALGSADQPFLVRLYQQGIRGFYDGISFHPYNEWRDPRDPWQPQYRQYTFLPGIQWIRETQVAQRDTTPLWITEFGWTTATNTNWHVTDGQQAAYIASAFDLLRQMPYVRGAIVYDLRDEGADPGVMDNRFGLTSTGLAPKQAYWSLRQALTAS